MGYKVINKNKVAMIIDDCPVFVIGDEGFRVAAFRRASEAECFVAMMNSAVDIHTVLTAPFNNEVLSASFVNHHGRLLEVHAPVESKTIAAVVRSNGQDILTISLSESNVDLLIETLTQWREARKPVEF